MTEAPNTEAVHQLDHLFLELFEQLANQARAHSAESAHHVLNLSRGYLSETASDAMEDFFNIYFSDSEHLEQRKDDVNKDVDDIFDEVQAIMDAGGDLQELDHIHEDEELREARLGLSGIQKQLESIIRLEEGVREKLMPVMVSMQFEDAMNQRLDHILTGWAIISQALHSGETNDLEALAEQIGQLTSSSDETQLFYQEVLQREPPPEHARENHSLLDLFT